MKTTSSCSSSLRILLKRSSLKEPSLVVNTLSASSSLRRAKDAAPSVAPMAEESTIFLLFAKRCSLYFATTRST